MKNDKTNKKPRKVKNYLSSLCKWAKNNIKKIIAFLGCLFLLLGMCICSCRGSKVAKATQIPNESYYIVFPSAGGMHTSGQNLLIRPFYLSGDNDNYLLFFENSNNVGELRSYTFTETTENSYSVINIKVGGLTYRGSPILMNSSETSNVILWINEDYAKSSPSQTIYNCITSYVNCRVDIYGGYISYTLQTRTEDILNVTVTNTNCTDNTTYTIFLNWSNGYINGYDTGFSAGNDYGYSIGKTDGYYEGYDIGYNVGLGDGTELDNPLSFISSGIDRLFDIQIFGDIALGDVLRIGFACVLLGFIIKIFLGG